MNFGLNSFTFDVILLAYIVFGFICGMIRGAKRSSIRAIMLFVSLLVCAVITSQMTYKFMELDLSFLNINIDGAPLTTINQTLNMYITEAVRNLTPDEAATIVRLLTTVFVMAFGGVIFLLLFCLFKFLSLPIYWIINLILGRNDSRKHAFIGGLVGVLCNIMCIIAVFTPVVGYVNAFDVLVEGGVINGQEEVLNDEDLSIIYAIRDSYVEGRVYGVLDKASIGKIQESIFNNVTTVSVDGIRITLNDEVDKLGAIMALASDSSEEINAELLDKVLESRLILLGIKQNAPVLCSLIKGVIPQDGGILNDCGAVIDEAFESIVSLEAENVKACLKSLVDVAFTLSKNDGKELGEAEIKNIGKCLDVIVKNGLVESKSLLDHIVLPIMDQLVEQVNDECVNSIVVDLRDRISGGIESYECELAAATKFMNIESLVSSENIEENLVSLGKVMDEAVARNAKVINKEFINSTIVKLLDEFLKVDEGSKLYETVNTLKGKFDESVVSYEVEFDAISKLLSVGDVANAEDFTLAKDGAEVGKKIDEALALGGVVVDKQLVNGCLENIIDSAINEAPDFGLGAESIKERLEQVESYETEFGYVARLIAITENMNTLTLDNIDALIAFDGEEDAKTLGQRLDEIAPSVLVGDAGFEAIGKAINLFADDNSNYGEIISEIQANYAEFEYVDGKIVRGDEIYSYEQLTSAIAQFGRTLTDATEKLTGNEAFTLELAQKYEGGLNDLQNNIIVGKDGARKIAKQIAEDVKGVIEASKEGQNELAQIAIQAVADKVGDYIAYINARYLSEENESYVAEEDAFAWSNDGFETIVYDQPDDMTDYVVVEINHPFSYVFGLLEMIGEN